MFTPAPLARLLWPGALEHGRGQDAPSTGFRPPSRGCWLEQSPVHLRREDEPLCDIKRLTLVEQNERCRTRLDEIVLASPPPTSSIFISSGSSRRISTATARAPGSSCCRKLPPAATPSSPGARAAGSPTRCTRCSGGAQSAEALVIGNDDRAGCAPTPPVQTTQLDLIGCRRRASAGRGGAQQGCRAFRDRDLGSPDGEDVAAVSPVDVFAYFNNNWEAVCRCSRLGTRGCSRNSGSRAACASSRREACRGDRHGEE